MKIEFIENKRGLSIFYLEDGDIKKSILIKKKCYHKKDGIFFVLVETNRWGISPSERYLHKIEHFDYFLKAQKDGFLGIYNNYLVIEKNIKELYINELDNIVTGNQYYLPFYKYFKKYNKEISFTKEVIISRKIPPNNEKWYYPYPNEGAISGEVNRSSYTNFQGIDFLYFLDIVKNAPDKEIIYLFGYWEIKIPSIFEIESQFIKVIKD